MIRLFLGLMLCSAGTWASAEQHALLIGVGEVAALPPRLWLKGPPNDVTLMRETLLRRGFKPERITVLAQHVAGASQQPTYAAITAAMRSLLAEAKRGDTVVLHLAGHGTQVPQRRGAGQPEADGLDEVFLAEDTQRWDANSGRLPHALMDDDIGDWIDALVDRGATVWAVFDTCHAAGMARSDGRRTRTRAVAAEELGIPLAASSNTPPPARGGQLPIPPRMDGRVLAFAARGHEATAEEWLPRSAGMRQARMYGVFTHAVVQAMRPRPTSAQALAEGVAALYARDGRISPVPRVVGAGAALP